MRKLNIDRVNKFFICLLLNWKRDAGDLQMEHNPYVGDMGKTDQ